MRLSTLIQGLPLRPLRDEDPEVVELTDDSRQVRPGWLFVARGGGEAAVQYATDALQRGAVAVMAETEVAQVVVQRDAAAMVVAAEPGRGVDQPLAGELASRFFDHPARRLRLIGVTGTNGKTSVCYLVRHLLQAAGLRCGLIGTVETDDGHTTRPSELTTPGAIELMRLLATMARHGCDACAMECSSHALHQGRLAGLTFDAAVFTNLTGDHLDYHGTMAAYAEAKAKLFEQLAPGGVAVINDCDETGRALAERVATRGARVVTTRVSTSATHNDAEARGVVEDATAAGTRVVFAGPWGEVRAMLPLVGQHNVSNALQALAAAWAVAPLEHAALRDAIDSMPAVPGRLERVTPGLVHRDGMSDSPLPSSTKRRHLSRSSRDHEERDKSRRFIRAGGDLDNESPLLPTVFVDYAHTHDALENVLHALRPTVPPDGTLIVVFGCGGDRDRTKRPRMAEVACRLADRVWITSDNPRTEEPMAIIKEVMRGIPSERVSEPGHPGPGGGQSNEAVQHGDATHADRPGSGRAGSLGVRVEVDRATAIRRAILGAGPRDVVLIAGKGHEDYQILPDPSSPSGKRKIHFDDREHAAAALVARREQEVRPCPQTV